VLIAHFDLALCRIYQYFRASKDLHPGRVRLPGVGGAGRGGERAAVLGCSTSGTR
jgi:hypothetical protein